ncbi:hypothetical protein HMN09_00481800 [Mycena chlorophos]|uniref:Uncharacterized protein n=1 Tax=Mycena chlorophos TaxID=658473 RepID=A0A8H6WJR8_MYCCL|nr:hypothetical protein HMN09_00481800 [Mycena chlorophos]
MPVSGPFANLLGLTLGGMLYGIYLILFLVSMYLFVNSPAAISAAGSGGRTPTLWRKLGAAFKRPIVLASAALFVTATVTWILAICRNFSAFIYFNGGTTAGVYFDDVSGVAQTLQDGFLALSLTIGDGMIVYRLWVVWRNPYILLLPAASVLGLLISFSLSMYWTARYHLTELADACTWTTPTTVFIIFTNVYCTLFIAYKIFSVARASSGMREDGERRLMTFLTIFTESAAAYASYALLFIILHQHDMKLQFALQNTLPSVLGATNALINARLPLPAPQTLNFVVPFARTVHIQRDVDSDIALDDKPRSLDRPRGSRLEDVPVAEVRVHAEPFTRVKEDVM